MYSFYSIQKILTQTVFLLFIPIQIHKAISTYTSLFLFTQSLGGGTCNNDCKRLVCFERVTVTGYNKVGGNKITLTKSYMDS